MAARKMNASEELQRHNANGAAHRFFLRVGGKARPRWRDEYTLPLFGLPLILEAEGLLSRDYAYLAKCEKAIADAAREWKA